jgi:hypothetical protein
MISEDEKGYNHNCVSLLRGVILRAEY